MSCISTGHKYVQLFTYSWYYIYTPCFHIFRKKVNASPFLDYDLFSFCKHPGVHRIKTSPNLQFWHYHFITSRARTSWWMASSSTWRFVVWGEFYACSTHATSMGESLYQTIWLNEPLDGRHLLGPELLTLQFFWCIAFRITCHMPVSGFLIQQCSNFMVPNFTSTKDEIYWFFYDPHERNTVDASEIPNSQPATVGCDTKKTVVNNGISTPKLNWFSCTINDHVFQEVDAKGPSQVPGRGWVEASKKVVYVESKIKEGRRC